MKPRTTHTKFTDLIRLDCIKAFRQTYHISAMMTAAYIAVTIVTSCIFGKEITITDRYVIIFMMSLVYMVYIPSAAYEYINSDRNSLMGILLPVSRRMKFISMISVGSILLPSVLLTLLHLSDILVYRIILHDKSYTSDILRIVNDFTSLIMLQSVFVFGNIVLKKHKITIPLGYLIIFLGLKTFLPIADSKVFLYTISLGLYILSYDRFKNLEL